ncbi:SH3 domain-containing protein [Streptomyces sp. NPDC002018]|uniref:SH3 domain-containing protein n=1 Tax=Streptomyces sp. NPDC002018 TaxID=3364629 RepID=UPI0036A73A77
MPVRSLGRTAAALTVSAVAAATLATVCVAPAAASPAVPAPWPAEPAAGAPEDNAPSKTQAGVQAPNRFRGQVTARTGLLLRDKPTRSSRVVGELGYGDIVRIFCRVVGDNVDGNNRWYLLADGSYAWSSARYIRSIGELPHWC